MIPPKQNTKPRELTPAGTHIARVVGLICIGTVKGTWQGTPTETYKIRLTWELPNELRTFKEGEPQKPLVISKEVGFSMGKKSTLRPIVEGIIGTSLTDEEAYGFDIEKIMGLECLISVIHEEKQEFGRFATLKSTAPLMRGTTCPPQVNETKILSYENWDNEYFMSLPDFIREKIEKTPEYQKMKSPNEFQELRDAHNSQIPKGEVIDASEIPF